MADLLEGYDSEGSEDFCEDVYNLVKNHWQQSDPIANLAGKESGMILSDSDDEKLYHIIDTSPGFDEILQANFSYDTDVQFHDLILHGDFMTEEYIRRMTVLWNDCFDHGIGTQRYTWTWDITSLNTQGNGTNTIDTTPSHITLTTSAVGIGDNEGTRTEFAVVERARKNRSEILVDLSQTVNTQFYFGWNTSGTNAMVAAADEYVIVFFDDSDDPNWQIKVGNGATEDVFTSTKAASMDNIRHEIWVETDGTVHWAIDGVEIDITGSVSNKMTASDHYLIIGQLQSVTGAAVLVAEIDYIENEKLKAH